MAKRKAVKGRRWRSRNYGQAHTTGRRTGGAGATIQRSIYREFQTRPVFFWHAWTTREWSVVAQAETLEAAKRAVERWLDRRASPSGNAVAKLRAFPRHAPVTKDG